MYTDIVRGCLHDAEVVADLGLLNSYRGFTVPLIASATATFLFRQFFLTVPDELLEAARIDGAGPMRFFAYILVPVVKGIRLRTRFGQRQRPVPIWVILGALYLVMFGAASLVWQASAPRILNVIHVSGPAAIDRLFSDSRDASIDGVLARLPGSPTFRGRVALVANVGSAYLERQLRSTFDDLLAAYKDQPRGLIDGGCDLLLLETIVDTLNAKAGIVAIEEVFEEKGVRLPLMISATISPVPTGTVLLSMMMVAPVSASPT